MLVLRAKPNETSKHGNAIMYGGETKQYDLPTMLNNHEPYELFYVETDFGNHMKLSWSELTSMFEVVRVMDYERWKMERSDLRNQPNYMQQGMHRQGIDTAMFNLRKDFP
jgi:hypothetical protein